MTAGERFDSIVLDATHSDSHRKTVSPVEEFLHDDVIIDMAELLNERGRRCFSSFE